MNIEQQHRPDPARRAKEESPRSSGTPTHAESQTSALARHRDPSLVKKTGTKTTANETEEARRRVVWMRPSELMMQAGGRAAGRGIDFQAELARRGRRLPGQTMRATLRAISERARRLPPVTAFGIRARSHPAPARSGIGLR